MCFKGVCACEETVKERKGFYFFLLRLERQENTRNSGDAGEQEGGEQAAGPTTGVGVEPGGIKLFHESGLRRNLGCCSPWGRKESDTTEQQASTAASTSAPASVAIGSPAS